MTEHEKTIHNAFRWIGEHCNHKCFSVFMDNKKAMDWLNKAEADVDAAFIKKVPINEFKSVVAIYCNAWKRASQVFEEGVLRGDSGRGAGKPSG